MTSQTEVSMDELKAEAKALNIGGWQACKDPEKLKKKIADAKSGTSTRKKAPKLRVASSSGNARNDMIAKLEREDPDCKYMTQGAGLTSAEADAKGVEIVKKENGDILYCGEDIVCRTDKQSYHDWQNDRNRTALKSMKSIDPDLETKSGGKKIQSVTEQPKVGRDPE